MSQAARIPGPGQIHWLTTDIDGRGLAARLPGLRLGWRRAHRALQHASVERIEITLREPIRFSLDADLYPETREVALSAGPSLRFASV